MYFMYVASASYGMTALFSANKTTGILVEWPYQRLGNTFGKWNIYKYYRS